MLSFYIIEGSQRQVQIVDAQFPSYWEKPIVNPNYVNSVEENNPDVWTEFPFTLQCTDIDMDGWDEIVSTGGDSLDIFSVRGDLSKLKIGGSVLDIKDRISIPINPIKWSLGLRRQFIVSDVNADTNDIASGATNWYPELQLVDCSTPWGEQNWETASNLEMQLKTFELQVNGSKNSYEQKSRKAISGMSALKNFSMAPCDYDGDGLRLKKPKATTIEGLIQPLVILNSPPVHYDVINDTTFDINSAFNKVESNFFSEYNDQQVQSHTVTTEFNRDWGLSASLTHEVMVAGTGVRASLEARYGNGFSKIDEERKTTIIETRIKADREDQIYYSKTNYHFLEYPVFYHNKLIGNILVATPDTAIKIEKSWIGIKNWKHNSYIQSHEIGNILSYNLPEYNFNVSDENNSNFVLPSQEIGNTGTFDGSIKFEHFSNNQTTTSHSFGFAADLVISIGFEASISVSPFGVGTEFGVKGTDEFGAGAYYDQKEIKTTTTSISNSWELSYHLSNVDPSIPGGGEVEYEIKPYIYWSNNGGLILDFATDPVGSWWNYRYGKKPDLSFNLPWRYQTEMGYSFTPGEEYKRYETKDIFVKPPHNTPGDTVEIITCIHNFSLAGIKSEDSVKIHYHLGDPDNGGNQITDLLKEGYSQSLDYNIREPRSQTFYYARWIIPDNITSDERLYVIIDPDNTIDEIHENNNKGYVALNIERLTSLEAENKLRLPTKYQLLQNYPNPFNPITKISYEIAKSEKVTLDIYNILGQRVKQLENDFKTAGLYTIDFNAKNFSSGVYFYKINAGEFTDVKKMIIIK